MPIYEYQCKKCEYKFDELQKISEETLKICPKCDEPELVKLVSHTSFQLKGTGWYVTDFKDKKKPAEKPKLEDTKPIPKKENKTTEKSKT